MTDEKRRGLPWVDIAVFLIAGGLAVHNFWKHGTSDGLRLLVFTGIAVFSLVSLIRYARRPR